MSENLIGLGRLEIEDERDANFPMSARLSGLERGWRYWNSSGWYGDQGQTAMCVAYSWAHWCEDGPFTRTSTPWRSKGGHAFGGFRGQEPIFNLDHGYNWMQRNDYWPGEDYDGTSVRAGAKYLVEQKLASEYRWAWDAETVAHAILEVGPVVVGTMWYMDMFTPREYKHIDIIEPTGRDAGGHAYVLNGVNLNQGWFRIKNSWGMNWGTRSHAYISFDDMDGLIKDHGEACIALP